MSFGSITAPTSAGSWVATGQGLCKRARILQPRAVAVHASSAQQATAIQQRQSAGSPEQHQPSKPAPLQSSPELWHELLGADEDEPFNARARSASDAAVLRRKGHLKEQDFLIEFLLRMHETHTCQEVFQKLDKWIVEHRQDGSRSRLKRMVPTLGCFFTPLRLVEAFQEYDRFFALSRRTYVPPNFAELRHILNIAQVHASAQSLKLCAFDADGTLYADGHHIEHDNQMVSLIVSLMRSGVYVAIVTAAGYPGEADRFEQRIEGLVNAFRRLRLPQVITDRFFVMGGECNYLLRIDASTKQLAFVPDQAWKSPLMMSWSEEAISGLLDSAQLALKQAAGKLCLPVEVIRKPRAVGVVPKQATVYEVLEEVALTVQHQLVDSPLPFCAFNGGQDVFVDIGNKSIGLEALMKHLDVSPPQVLHVGDRFTISGNDKATRDCCCIVWVANPEETGFFIKLLLNDIRAHRAQPYIE
ncbi:hypothetical protein WJX84_001213 [Apatococcus fuscideae]|uniref:IMP-specific 5'-nucleotidase 1 n=1 Tax=Apatococcus fuscideae TaxID=2026836 RepID=A0AAW1SYI5_9CHLO